MKLHPCTLLCATLASASLALAEPQTGGRFTMEAAVIPSGGGHASGGRFSVTATVDQPATEPGTAGRFALDAGFWAPVIVEQTADAPPLAIEILPDGMVRLHWAATKASFVLEGTASLTTPEWQDFLSRPESDGVEISIVIPPTELMRCFRLRPVP